MDIETFVFINNGFLLQAILSTNSAIENTNFYESAAGKFEPVFLFKKINQDLEKYRKLPDFQSFPGKIDFSLTEIENYIVFSENKRYFTREAYHSMQPLRFTKTLIHSKTAKPTFLGSGVDYQEDSCLSLRVSEHSYKFAYTSVFLLDLSSISNSECRYHTKLERIRLKLHFEENNSFEIDIIVNYVATPNKYSRVLVDSFYNLKYPFDGFIPKDNVTDNRYLFDWNFDSLETNYFSLYKSLVDAGFVVEESNQSIDCIELSNYAVFVLIDTEKNFSATDIKNLKYSVEKDRTHLLLIQGWDDDVLKEYLKFETEDNVTLPLVGCLFKQGKQFGCCQQHNTRLRP